MMAVTNAVYDRSRAWLFGLAGQCNEPPPPLDSDGLEEGCDRLLDFVDLRLPFSAVWS